MKKILALALSVAALAFAVPSALHASTVGPGSGSCLDGACCPSAAYPYGSHVYDYGYWWTCFVDNSWHPQA